MATTSGHGNPSWNEDEIVLALDLYFDLNGSIPGADSPQIIELSNVLRSLPYHLASARKPSFRNPDGVVFKLQNLRKIDTGKGLGNVSRTDKTTWARYGLDRSATKCRAELIRQAVQLDANLPDYDDEDSFAEGQMITRLHKRRERDKRLRRLLLKHRRSAKNLFCDVCGYANLTGDPRFDEAGLEAHHLHPLSEVGESSTKLPDVALLCATCHRLTHRAISVERRWLSVLEIRVLLSPMLSSG